MVSIVTKQIYGKEYLYLVGSVRKGAKVVQKTIKYIGKKRPVSKEEFECMKMSYNEEDWVLNKFEDQLPYTYHEEMRKVSAQRQEYLKGLDEMSLEKEKERFISRFIANSNAIEGSTLTVRDTHNFLFEEIVPRNRSKKELFMASNLLEGWWYVEKNCGRFPTHRDLKELHKLVNRQIEGDETLGRYKKVQNYIGDVLTTSYLFVEERMERLLVWIKEAFFKMDNFEVAFQSHAQFELIHPFVDGNGRVGRLLLNWLLMNKGLAPVVISVEKRGDYLETLGNSQKGAMKAICEFCYREYLKGYEFV